MSDEELPLRALRRAVADAAAAVEALHPPRSSPHGRAGVLLGRAVWRVLRPYTWRSRRAGSAIVDALQELSLSLSRIASATAALEREVETAQRRLDDLKRDGDAAPAWVIPRIRADGAIVAERSLVIPRAPAEPKPPPAGWVRVDTDEGELWALSADPVLTPALVQAHTWEPEFTSVLARHVRPGMTTIDIGANIGYVTRTLARLAGPDGSVLALEPEPRNYEVLCANSAGNARIRCLRAAALDRTGEVTLWLSSDNLGDHRTWTSSADAAGSVRVPGVRIDDLLDDSISVDVVKVDTQGTDHLVVAGMEATIARCRPTVFVEFWLDGLEGVGADAHRILDYYRALGFDLAVVDAPGRAFRGNDEIVAFAERNRGRYLDLLLTPS